MLDKLLNLDGFKLTSGTELRNRLISERASATIHLGIPLWLGTFYHGRFHGIDIIVIDGNKLPNITDPAETYLTIIQRLNLEEAIVIGVELVDFSELGIIALSSPHEETVKLVEEVLDMVTRPLIEWIPNRQCVSSNVLYHSTRAYAHITVSQDKNKGQVTTNEVVVEKGEEQDPDYVMVQAVSTNGQVIATTPPVEFSNKKQLDAATSKLISSFAFVSNMTFPVVYLRVMKSREIEHIRTAHHPPTTEGVNRYLLIDDPASPTRRHALIATIAHFAVETNIQPNELVCLESNKAFLVVCGGEPTAEQVALIYTTAKLRLSKNEDVRTEVLRLDTSFAYLIY